MKFLLLFIIKVLDNIIMTAKSIATYKEKILLSSILVVLSQFLFYTLIKQVMIDNTIFTIIIISVASGLGNVIAFLINNRFKKDSRWEYVLCGSDIEDIKKLCNYLIENNIKFESSKGYTRKWKDTINVRVFSQSKAESRKIEKFLSEYSNSKYLKIINK